MAVCRTLACAAAVACTHTCLHMGPEVAGLCATCSFCALRCTCSLQALWECVWSLGGDYRIQRSSEPLTWALLLVAFATAVAMACAVAFAVAEACADASAAP